MDLRLALNLLCFLLDLCALYALCHSPNFYEIHPRLMFHLEHNYINSETVLQLQMDTEKFNETEIHGYTTVFCGRGRIAQPMSSLSSICIVFCIVVLVMKWPVLRKRHITISP